MKKILFLIPTLGHGGAERVLVNLVNHMDYSKFDVTVQTLFDVGIYQDKLNKQVHYKGGFPWYFRGNTHVFKIFSPKQLYKMYVKEHYDVIVSYLEGSSARVAAGCTDKDCKLVCWIHIEQKSKEYAKSVYRNWEECVWCNNKFDRIICVSDTVKQDFNSLFNVKVPVNVLYNTVEADVITSRSKEKIDDIEFSKDEINIISVAKLMKTKGYDRLIEVQKQLRDLGFPVHVYIVGKGEEEDTLKNLAKQNGVDKYFTLVGFRDNPYKYVANADLYVCSSRAEGFSTAVTESLIVGTPVVSTDCSGAYELLGKDNEYGIVTQNDTQSLFEGVKLMLQSGNLEHYKEMAYKRGKKFNTEETVKAVEDMLLEVDSE